jgi:hypothetical protein
MEVVEMGGKLFTICPKDSEVAPIPLDEDALEQYEFSIERLLERLRVVNGFGGTLQKIDQELFYLGHTTYRGSRVGFVFGFTCASKSVLELTGLKRLCADDDFLVVFSPVSVIEDVSIKRELGHEGIVQTSFGLSLNFQTYQLSIEKLLSGVIAQKDAETGQKNNKGRRKRGRKKDPKIKTRNRQIAEFKANNPDRTYKEVGRKFKVSAEVARKACNNPDN